MMDITKQKFVKGYILGYKKYVKSKVHRKLARFIDKEYSDVLEYTRKLTCPFCGRRMRGKSGLVRHLRGGRCGKHFSYLVLEVVDRYLREVKGAGM